jgi:hypothetical protein
LLFTDVISSSWLAIIFRKVNITLAALRNYQVQQYHLDGCMKVVNYFDSYCGACVDLVDELIL